MFLATVTQDVYGDCSNGGLSSRTTQVLVVSATEQVRDELAQFAVVYNHRYGETKSGVDYRNFTPLAPVADGHVGYMASGAKIWSDDPEFEALTGNTTPVSFHDRTETYAQYDALSR